ncbi:hypothetical protein Tco_1028458 [Tanacetum coccineum]|uniref:Uncharacterized protein n=1 Tax=Tanacetum coccineum TaxID=301880 RepID=A0ABQ5G2U3_9ASTR
MHQCRLLKREAWSPFEVSVGITEEGEVSSVKDKILATSSETSKVENAPAEMMRDLDQQIEKRADDVKPRRVRAMAMTIQYGVRGMILTAQSEAFKQENVLAEILHGLDQQMERKGDKSLSPVLWAEIGESSLTGPELVLDTTDKGKLALRSSDKTLCFVKEPLRIVTVKLRG